MDDGKLTIFSRKDMVVDLQNIGSGFVELIIRLAGKGQRLRIDTIGVQ